MNSKLVPRHLMTSHPQYIENYWQRRSILGDPFAEEPATTIPKLLSYEIKKLKNDAIATEEFVSTYTLMVDFNLSYLQICEIIMAIEDHYEGVDLGASFDKEIWQKITIGELVELVEKSI